MSDWAKTQDTGLVGQLNCGARAFDYRPYYNKGELYAHHGGVQIHKRMSESISEILDWNEEYNTNDLVLLYLSHFDGDEGCQDATIQLLQSSDIYTITDCTALGSLTYTDAKSKSKLTNGGYLLAVVDCMEEYYDSTVNCYGSNYVCYDSWPQNSSSIPMDKLESYMTSVTSSYPDNPNTLWMAQGHWQQTALTISLGTLHKSSIVNDELQSGVNNWLAQKIDEKAFSSLNIIEVDNVCDGGMDIYNSLHLYH